MANPLIGYAFLKVNFDNGVANILDLTLPLTRRALYQWPGKDVTTDILQTRIETLWGISIPQNVLRSLLPKLRSQGRLIFDNVRKVYRLSATPSEADEILKRERAAQAIYSRVISKIRAEMLRQSIEFKDAQEVLGRFLDSGAVSFIQDGQRAMGKDKFDDAALRIVIRAIGVFSAEIDQSFLDDLQSLIIGDLLYKAIFSISEAEVLDPINGRMNDVDVYLDTGVLFRALGLFGPLFEKPAIEMLEICKATGCRLKTFPHNVDEVSQGLLAVAGRLYSGGAFGPIVSYALEHGVSPSDLVEESRNVQDRIKKLGIVVAEMPALTVPLSIDERHLDWQVEIDVRQNNPQARTRDVNSLAAIYRLREGQPQTALERCGAILVTSNKSLADASVRYFQALFNDEGKRNIVQLCMTDVVLTTRLWLKVPTKFSDVPRSQILSHAISNLRPSQPVLSKFLELVKERLIAKKISPEQAAMLSFSNLVRGILALETENDPNRLDEDIFDTAIATGIRQIRDQMRRIEVTASASGARRVEIETANKISDLEDKLSSLATESQGDKVRLEDAQQEISVLRDQLDAIQAARTTSRKLSSIVTKAIMILTLPILLCGIAAPIVAARVPTLANWQTLQLISAAVGAFLGLLTIYGASHFQAVNRLQDGMQIWIEQWLREALR